MTLHFKYVCVLGKAVLPVDKRILSDNGGTIMSGSLFAAGTKYVT